MVRGKDNLYLGPIIVNVLAGWDKIPRIAKNPKNFEKSKREAPLTKLWVGWGQDSWLKNPKHFSEDTMCNTIMTYLTILGNFYPF